MSTSSPSTTETPVKAKRRRAPAPAKSSQAVTALSRDGTYRVAQFCPSITGFCKTRWYTGVKSGEFPAPVVQGKRLTLWNGGQILDAVARFGQP
jgi:predicted DNA-binding transcriptional regulator AlpA